MSIGPAQNGGSNRLPNAIVASKRDLHGIVQAGREWTAGVTRPGAHGGRTACLQHFAADGSGGMQKPARRAMA